MHYESILYEVSYKKEYLTKAHAAKEKDIEKKCLAFSFSILEKNEHTSPKC